MKQNSRRFKKLKKMVIYLCNNNLFYMLFAILELVLFILIFLYNSNDFIYSLLFITYEIGLIINAIRENDMVKDNKLIYVIFSKKFPILYPLILLCLYFAFYICIFMDYFINFNFMLIYVGVFCILFPFQIVLVKKINKFFIKKLK